jgi:hypothetical protein
MSYKFIAAAFREPPTDVGGIEEKKRRTRAFKHLLITVKNN